MSSPLFLFFLLVLPFLLFNLAAGFLLPRPRIVAGRRAQMLSRLAALQRPHPLGASAFTAIEHDGKLEGSGRLHSCLLFIRLRVSARVILDNGCFFWQVLLRSPMGRAIIASTYIRQLRFGLPRCC